jgi:hypothetical protein
MYRWSKRIVICLLAATAIIGLVATGCSAKSGTATQQSRFGRGQRGGNPPDMTAMLSQVAQELGVPEDELASAYQQARDSVMPTMPPRNPGSQWQGPPPGGPGGGQGFGNFRMSIYNKMSETLNIPADEIAAAFSKFQPQSRPNRGGAPPPQ